MKITYLVYLSTIHFYTVCFLLLEISKHGVVFILPWNACLLGVLVPKPYIPHQNSHTNGTSLGCRLASKMISIARNCAVWIVLWKQAPHPKYCFIGQFFGGLQNPYMEIRKFLMGVCSSTPIRVCCFKHDRNRCRISVRKAALYWWQKTKHV